MSFPLEEVVSRRRFLSGAGGSLAGLFLLVPLSAQSATGRKFVFTKNPFTLGIASGDPAPNGIVLWTRLALDPLNGGGMPPENVPVQWRIAKDDKMQNVVQKGVALAAPALGHSVHVEVNGLEPARPYWYQFSAGGVESAIGRTRTAPPVGAHLQKVTFAFASCQNWQDGLYTAYDHMAREDLQFMVHLGDYIYETAINPAKPRQHNQREPADLTGYRNQYAQYKTDGHLQAAHAAFPWIVTWDDHEVENNYAGMHRDNQNPPGDFRLRRAAAYQAYYEHQPLRRASLPVGPDMLLYRRLGFGDLLMFNVLDTRQYRTPQVTQKEHRGDPSGVILGQTQEAWLLNGLDKSRARWNVLAQQIFMAQRDYEAGPETRYGFDSWDGYTATRDRLMHFLEQRKPTNPVVLSGDVHNNWVADLKADFNNPASKIVGTEFIGTSISSSGDGSDMTEGAKRIMNENPHVKFFNGHRGYVRCTVTPETWRSDFRVVPFVSKPGAPVSTRASFVVENGKPGAVRDGK